MTGTSAAHPATPDPDAALVSADWTAVETFLQCGRRFASRWLEQAPEAFEPVDTVLDGAVRDTIAWFVASSRGDLVPAESAIGEEFRRRWAARLTPAVRVVRAGDRVEAFAHRGELMVRRLVTAWPPAPGLHIDAIDRSFRLRLRGTYDLTVRADLVGHDGAGALHVFEFDTGTRPATRPSPAVIDRLDVAGLAILLARKLESIRLTRLRLTDAHRDERRLTRFDGARLVSVLADSVAAMHAASGHAPAASVACAWCGFREQCEASGLGGRFVALPELGACTRCGNGLGLRKGRLGVFITCARYPECRCTKDL